MVVIKKPKRSKLVKLSCKKSQAMKADVAGIKKNIETVLLAELFLIKYINIVKAPKETKNIWWLIAIINVCEKSMYGFAKNIMTNRWKVKPPIAWYILLTDNGKLLLSFFCQIVEDVIAIKAIIVAIKPAIGISEPISKPKTNAAPTKPNKTPVHCLIVTFSFKIGPLKAFVSIGWRVTINAAIPVGIPIDIE